MSEKTDTITSLLIPFGLTSEEAQVYIFLAQNGYSSALAISRSLKIARTKVYRILDRLITAELAIQKIDDRGKKFGASDPEKLGVLVGEKEHKIASLKDNLPLVISRIKDLQVTRNDESKILYYTGVEGLKQVTYNSTKATGTLRIIEKVNDMSKFVPKKFSEDMRSRFVERGVKVRQITTHRALLPFTQNNTFVQKHCELRHIPRKRLAVEFEVLIYDDVYAMYNTKEKEAFCVEIYNTELARMQTQIFDFLWNSAARMEFMDEQGSARIV